MIEERKVHEAANHLKAVGEHDGGNMLERLLIERRKLKGELDVCTDLYMDMIHKCSEAREAAKLIYLNHVQGSDYGFDELEKRWPWLKKEFSDG